MSIPSANPCVGPKMSGVTLRKDPFSSFPAQYN